MAYFDVKDHYWWLQKIAVACYTANITMEVCQKFSNAQFLKACNTKFNKIAIIGFLPVDVQLEKKKKVSNILNCN